ncbi:uncharacterized protein [Diadema antillarum]|uniref:uncharacterized protein n=1 Tax=Diadema antillarum TaxID=105358 RepID=UPI003A8A4E71
METGNKGNGDEEEESQLGDPEAEGCREEDVQSPVKIVTSHVEDIDTNSEYMYNINCYQTENPEGEATGDEISELESETAKLSLGESNEDCHKEGDDDEKLADCASSSSEKLAPEATEEVDAGLGRQFAVEPENSTEITTVYSEPDAENEGAHTESMGGTDESNSESVQLVDGMLKSANADVANHKYSRAVDKYEQALSMANKLNDKFLVQSCACNLGAVLVILGKAERAVSILQEQLQRDLVRTNGTNSNALADIYYNLGLAYDAKGDTNSAINCFHWAVEEFEKWDNERGRADSHNQLAELLTKQSKLEEARVNYSKAAELYSSTGNGLMRARMLVKEARMLNALADAASFQRVFVACEKASKVVLAQMHESMRTKEAKLFHDMAVLCKKRGNNEEGLRWLRESWKRCRGAPTQGREETKLQAAVAQSLARMYLHSCDLINAIHVYQQAAALHGVLGNQADRGWCFFYLGEAYRQLCDYPNAERSFHVAHQTFTDAGTLDALWRISEGLGDVNVARNHPDMATMYYREALAIRAPSHSRTRSASERVVSKLTRALEGQKMSQLDLVADRRKREPILVGYDPSVFKPLKGKVPVTSTPNSISPPSRALPRMRSASKRKKGKRQGQRHTPVARGVGMYNSETDLSLVSGSVAAGIQQAYKQKGRNEHYLSVDYSHHMTRRSVTPSGSEEDDQPEEAGDDRSEGSTSSDSGYRNIWQRAKALLGGKSDSEDSILSSDEEGEEEEEEGAGAMERTKPYTSLKRSDKRKDPDNEEDEGIHSKESDRFDNTYEHPRSLQENQLYAKVNKGATQRSNKEEPLYESLRCSTMGASMPTRDPPPPLPPLESHPSLLKKKKKKTEKAKESFIDRPSTSYDDDDVSDDSFTSVTEEELESLQETNYPTVERMTRGRLEQGLYEMKKLEDERQQLNDSIQPSLQPKEKKKQPSSRVCSIM